MRDRIDIDRTHSRAIIREIGERLQASLGQDGELPDGLRRQIDQLHELDEKAPSSVPDLPGDEGSQATAAQTSPSPVQWTTRWWSRR
ncbi:hypothetical protein [Bradyrhizobium jicamae]|uniref:hypothetical protein n=1 Tax=Bradyrhizobium jicamae TaxID=280332 RepID=UPI001BABBB63|nr:hypothetical protein [Bradyrhizobium jicamae]MBR0939370.1 hypothetical protein [Bradyrhizobium jicamae]